MSRLERADTIEAKVGAKRHQTAHLARAVSITERVYVLHSKECVARGIDLRECEYSIALDEGIDLGIWAEHQDRPVFVTISDEHDDLEPTDSIPGAAPIVPIGVPSA